MANQREKIDARSSRCFSFRTSNDCPALSAITDNLERLIYFTLTPQQIVFTGLSEEEELTPCVEEPVSLQLVDVKTNGGVSIVYRSQCDDGNIYMFHNAVNPAPAPPNGVFIQATPPDEWGYRYPRITWAMSTERDIDPSDAYEIWRKTSGGFCGTSNWYRIADNIPATQTEFTDLSIGTVMPGGDCKARYYLTAKDNANGMSDSSKNVVIDYTSNMWKTGNQHNEKPVSYSLHSAYPNPFNPSTQIKYDLPEASHVTLAVYDVLGRKVAELVNGQVAEGYHTATWNATGVASGMYFARFTASDAPGQVKLSRVNKLLHTK